MLFDIVVTQRCNLSCRYCFEEKKDTLYMRESQIQNIDDFIFRYLDNDWIIEKENILINFNGGESLLNFQFIKSFVERTKIKVSRYSVSTNLSVLTEEMILFFSKHNFTLHVSIDGKKRTNDKNRIDNEGNSYYDTLFNNLMRIKKTNIHISLSLVYTPETVASVAKNVRFLYKLGFNYIDLSYTTNFPWILKKEKVITREFKKLSRLVCKSYISRNPLRLSIFSKQISRIIKRRKCEICGAFIDEITIMPEGKILPCLGYMGNDLTEKCNFGNWNIVDSLNEKEILSYRKNVEQRQKLCNDCDLSGQCHKTCLLELELTKNKNQSLSAMNCLVNKLSYFESEKIILTLLNKKNNCFIKEYNIEELFEK